MHACCQLDSKISLYWSAASKQYLSMCKIFQSMHLRIALVKWGRAFQISFHEGRGDLSLSRSRKSNKSACLRDLQTTEKSYKLSLHVVGIYKRPTERLNGDRERSFCFTRKLLRSPHLHRARKSTPITTPNKRTETTTSKRVQVKGVVQCSLLSL